MTSSRSSSLSPEELTKIEQDFDPEMSFRQFGPILTLVVTFFLVTMSIYHFYASGFGLVRELVHYLVCVEPHTEYQKSLLKKVISIFKEFQ